MAEREKRPAKARGNGRYVGRRQHFLLTAGARTMGLKQVARLSEDEAHALFELIRWSRTGGEPICPRCNCLAVYRHKKRRLFTCKACEHQFSVTSGTAFHSRKLPVGDILLAIALFANGAKGHAALELGRDLDVNYKTAFVLEHKLREAIGAGAAERAAAGEVEVDGAYFGGHAKPANRKDDRVDRRKAVHQNGKREVVVVMRERKGRTLPFVVPAEHEAVETLEARIEPGSTVYADEARSWDPLAYGDLDLRRINHQQAYSDRDGTHTNGAESFFSRLRRSEIGIHHHIAGPYLDGYALEMAWREDSRRLDNGSLALLFALAALSRGHSAFRGYWQRHLTELDASASASAGATEDAGQDGGGGPSRMATSTDKNI